MQFRYVACRAFPNDNDPPTHSPKTKRIVMVTLDISFELVRPELSPCFGKSAAGASVAMPKTSVHEHHGFEPSHNDVG